MECPDNRSIADELCFVYFDNIEECGFINVLLRSTYLLKTPSSCINKKYCKFAYSVDCRSDIGCRIGFARFAVRSRFVELGMVASSV